MCLIVVKDTKKGVFTDANFNASYNRNSDGMGIMWLEDGRVKVERVLGTLAQQRFVWNKHKHKDMWVLHQRYATHGSKAKMLENCHPYKIMDMDDGDVMDIYMAHNGVISDTETTDASMSDTWNFIENHIKPIVKHNPELLWNDAFQMMINKYIGSGSKLVVLSNRKKDPMLIFNEEAGTVVNGCWLSNTYSITPTVTTHKPIAAPYRHTSSYLSNYAKPTEKAFCMPDITAWKEDCKQAVLEGTLDIEDVKSEFTEEELNYLEVELDELEDQFDSEFVDSINAVYDPENVDKDQLKILVDKIAKEFNYVDLERLIDVLPQVAADVMEHLLSSYVSNQLFDEQAA
jgi:hypothetical protein